MDTFLEYFMLPMSIVVVIAFIVYLVVAFIIKS